jgi:hypothetical protein
MSMGVMRNTKGHDAPEDYEEGNLLRTLAAPAR